MALKNTEKIEAVADASFLIGLCSINQWRLLEKMVDHLYIAPAVWEEVVDKGKGRPGTQEIQHGAFIKKLSVQNKTEVEILKIFLGPGEAESLVLAHEIGCSIVFVDELKARKTAQKAGLKTMGIAGFLLTAKQKGFIKEIKPLLEALQLSGFRLSKVLIDKILKEAGELSLIE